MPQSPAVAARPPIRSGSTTCSPTPRITLQDGTQSWPAVARLLEGAERDQWWERCVAAFPTYADYARKAERTIPVFLIERAG